MSFIEASPKDYAAIIRATFPDYKRKSIWINPRATVTLLDLNWSGGTRKQYRACTLAGVESGSSDKFAQQAPWRNQAEGQPVEIPRGFVVVEGGTFCGKTSKLVIWCHPDDLGYLLPGPNSTRALPAAEPDPMHPANVVSLPGIDDVPRPRGFDDCPSASDAGEACQCAQIAKEQAGRF